MKIEVAYASPQRQAILAIEVDENTSIEAAIRKSGILGLFPEIDLGVQKVGVFGRNASLDAPLSAGDRIEIYRPVVKKPRPDDAEEDAG
jgi:putative ubiquitin-RnfH superfamily antitoxin RatB of RatAB toxin-antitoxin module